MAGCWLTRLRFCGFVEREGSRGVEEEKCAVVNIVGTRIGERSSWRKKTVFGGAEGVVDCQAWWLREALINNIEAAHKVTGSIPQKQRRTIAPQLTAVVVRDHG